MAAYRRRIDDSDSNNDNGNTNVTQRGNRNRSNIRSNNRTTVINILGLGRG
jgi:hypothetical protein